MSNLSAVSVITSGWRMIIFSMSLGKYSSMLRLLIVMLPLPGLRYTRAVDVLRRPVP